MIRALIILPYMLMKTFFTQRSFFIKYLLILFLYGSGMEKISALNPAEFTWRKVVETKSSVITKIRVRFERTHDGKKETYEGDLVRTQDGTYKLKNLEDTWKGQYEVKNGMIEIKGENGNTEYQSFREAFNDFNRLEFSYKKKKASKKKKRNENQEKLWEITLRVPTTVYDTDFWDDPKKSWLPQGMAWRGTSIDNITNEAYAAVEEKYRGAPDFEVGKAMVDRMGKPDEPEKLPNGTMTKPAGNAKILPAFVPNTGFRHYVLNAIRRNLQAFDGVCRIYDSEPPNRSFKRYYNQKNIDARNKRGDKLAIAKMVLNHGPYLAGLLIIIFSIVSVVNNAARVFFAWLFKKLTTPTIFVVMTFPLNWFEGLVWFFSGGPILPEDNWDKIICTEEERAELQEHYEAICFAIDENKKLSKEDRAEHRGMGINNTIWGGPPGVGKSMRARALAMHLYYQYYTSNVIFIDGSEPSKLDIKDVVEALTVLQLIAITHYIKTGEPTIVVIDEVEQLCPSHIGGNVSWERQAFTAKLLALQARNNSPYLVFLCTTNLDVRPEHEKEAVKHIDRAVLSRMAKKEHVSKPGSDILMKVFIENFKEYAKEFEYEVDYTAKNYIKENFDMIARYYDTQRAVQGLANEWATKVLEKKIRKAVTKQNKKKRRKKANNEGSKSRSKKKKKKISKDDLISLVEALERKQEKDKEDDYEW